MIIPILVVAGGLAGWWFGYADGPVKCEPGVWGCQDRADNGKTREAPSSRPGNGGKDCPRDDDNDNGHGNDDDHDDDSNPGQGGGNHGTKDKGKKK